MSKILRNILELIMDNKRNNSLLCFEQLDRKSPDLWPDNLSGVNDFTQKCLSPLTPMKPPQKFNIHLEPDDLRYMNELGQLSADQLMDHIKNLQNTAYQLGLLEAKELNRGKFLKILESNNEKNLHGDHF